jgi:hypothetical protein
MAEYLAAGCPLRYFLGHYQTGKRPKKALLEKFLEQFFHNFTLLERT